VTLLGLVAVCALALFLEPVRHTFALGQVNLVLLAVVLVDLRRVAQGKSAGVGIGLATAVKLTPAVFVLLLLATRRTRAAIVATVTFVCCSGLGALAAPDASRRYWLDLFHDTHRVGASYIANQSPYGALVRLLNGTGHVGAWYLAVPIVVLAVGLAAASAYGRRGDWLAATAITGVTGLLVSPISWTHHWVWSLPALLLLWRLGRVGKTAAACAYVLLTVAPMWRTPHSGGAAEYGFHGFSSVAANSFLVAGAVFLAVMAMLARSLTMSAYQPLANRATHAASRR
jgi:alpha-1,2-mannosyltransferase